MSAAQLSNRALFLNMVRSLFNIACQNYRARNSASLCATRRATSSTAQMRLRSKLSSVK